MRRALLAAACLSVATLAVVFAPSASAADPAPLTVDASTACGRVTLHAQVNKNFAQAGFDTYELAVYAGPNAGGAASDPLGQFTVSAEQAKGVDKTFTLAEDSYGGSAFLSWSTISGPNPEFYVRGTASVNTDCAPPDPAPTTTTAPTTAPTPEPTAAPTSTTAPATAATTTDVALPPLADPAPVVSGGNTQVAVVPNAIDTGRG